MQMTTKAPTENSKGLRFGSFVQIRDIINEELESIWAGDKSAQERGSTRPSRAATSCCASSKRRTTEAA